jgi:hypothetical protein
MGVRLRVRFSFSLRGTDAIHYTGHYAILRQRTRAHTHTHTHLSNRFLSWHTFVLWDLDDVPGPDRTGPDRTASYYCCVNAPCSAWSYGGRTEFGAPPLFGAVLRALAPSSVLVVVGWDGGARRALHLVRGRGSVPDDPASASPLPPCRRRRLKLNCSVDRLVHDAEAATMITGHVPLL